MASPESEECQCGYKCIYEGDCVDYRCSSCLHLLREPYIASCCDKVYCKAFIEGKRKCPNCHSDLTTAYNKFLDKALQKEEVLCSENEYGCPWKGKVKEFDEHIACCEYVRVSCEKCHQAIIRNQIETHRMQDCPERPFSCPHCHHRSTYKDITESHIPVCQYSNRSSLEGRRTDLVNAINNECHLDCPFCPMGCGVKLTRDDEERHLKESSTSHLSSLASYVLQLDTKLSELTKTFKEFQQKVDKKIFDLEGEVSSLTSTVNELSKTINNQPDNDISPPETQAEPHRMGIDLESKLKEKDAQIQQLNQSLNACTEQQARFEQRLLKIEQSAQVSPQQRHDDTLEDTITVEGFTEKRRNQEYWSTPIFRNHEGIQHKLNLCVWPNGQNEGSGTHVSLWLEQEITQQQTTPPAHILVYVEVLNQLKDDNHIQIRCNFPLELQRYSAISNTAISHKDLEYTLVKGTRFLVNDTLKIRICASIVPLPYWNQ